MTFRPIIFVTLMLSIITTIGGLFFIKEKVSIIKLELSEIKRQIRMESDSIHILKAELAYLSAPERLKELNENFLKLSTTTPEQIIADPLSKKIMKDVKKVKLLASNKKQVKWRYKAAASQYITRASVK